MRWSPDVSWFTVLCALCSLQCAELKPFGDSCGNGALNEKSEDCDGASYNVAHSAGRAVTCGTSGPSACHFVCGAASECPSDAWACRGGICVLQSETFGAPREVMGAASSAYTADFDNDGADDLVAVPLSTQAPLVAHFSILDAAKATSLPLFPTSASSSILRVRPSAPRLQDGTLAVPEPSVMVAMTAGATQAVLARAVERSDGTLARKFEPVPLALSTVEASAVDFLFLDDFSGRQQSLVWVHGVTDELDDYVARWDASTGGIEPLLPVIPATDSYGGRVAEHRIVFAIPANKQAKCARVAVFTRETARPSVGTLQIFAPADATCDWKKRAAAITIAGRYPATRGAGGIVVLDLNHDGHLDLLVNARDPVDGFGDPTGDQVRTFVLYGPWSDGQKYVPVLDPNHLLIGTTSGDERTGYEVLTCTRAGRLNEAGLCLSEPGADLPSPKLQFGQIQNGVVYESELVNREVLAAGYDDFAGRGLPDVWAWFAGDTGVQLLESTNDGFFPNRLIDHGTASLRQIGSAQLNFASEIDLVALSETKAPPTTAEDSRQVESRVHITSGRIDIPSMTSDVIARFTGRASMAIGRSPIAHTPGVVRLAICGSKDCDGAGTDWRQKEPFALAELRALGVNFFATPANLMAARQCGPPFTGAREGLVSAAELASSDNARGLSAQLVAVGREPSSEPGSDVPIQWGTLHEGMPSADVSCGQRIPRDRNFPINYVALAPADAARDSWLLLLSQNTQPNPAGHAFLLRPTAQPVEVTINQPSPTDGYRAIYAEPHDLDGDGDTDFVVVEDHASEDEPPRPRLYVNVPCETNSQLRCLSVKALDGFAPASAVALGRSHIDARLDLPGCDADHPCRDYWFAALTENATEDAEIAVQRLRVTGKDRNLQVSAFVDPVTKRTSARQGLPLKVVDATAQRLVWGDFDGDGTLELLYVSNGGSHVYRRGDAPPR